MKKKLVAAIVAVSVVVGGNCVSAAPQQKAVKTYTENDIQTIKLYSKISEEYRALTNLGNMLSDFSHALDIASRDMAETHSLKNVEQKRQRFNQLVIMFNNEVNKVNSLQSEVSQRKINISDMQDILALYNTSFDKYEDAFRALYDTFDNPSKESVNRYISNADSAFDIALKGSEAAFNGYKRFYETIQKY